MTCAYRLFQQLKPKPAPTPAKSQPTPRTSFNLKPLNFSYPKKVYRIVKKIPRGKTLSYKEVAGRAGRPKAWRAVGNILNKNYDPKIPCHRVIRSDGGIGGYNRGVKEKIKRLREEGFNRRVKS